MNILVVYTSIHRDDISELRNNMTNWSDNIKIFRLKHAKDWHIEARRIIKAADIIVYCVSKDSLANKNVNWELQTALKNGRSIICMPIEAGISKDQLNPVLLKKDPFTKQKQLMALWVCDDQELKKMIVKYSDDEYVALYNNNQSDKNDSINTNDTLTEKTLLEQYRLFCQTAENLLSRRQNVNNFYITANTALVSICATIFGLSGSATNTLIIVLFLTLPGILLNISWKNMLTSYFINNRAKIKIISMMEKRLPASTYDAEWRVMKNKFSNEKYISFTESESQLPKIFILFYVVTDIVVIAALLAMGLGFF